jgi:hypothetical protein
MALRSTGVNGEVADEASMVKLYMDLTGSTESQARNVFMYVYSDNNEEMDSAEDVGMEAPTIERSAWQWGRRELSATWAQLEHALPLRVPSPAFET